MKFKIAASIVSIAKKWNYILAMICFVGLPAIGISQPGGPGGGGEGGNPDDAVPFDDNMNLVFLAVGILFAVVIAARQMKRNAAIKAA